MSAEGDENEIDAEAALEVLMLNNPAVRALIASYAEKIEFMTAQINDLRAEIATVVNKTEKLEKSLDLTCKTHDEILLKIESLRADFELEKNETKKTHETVKELREELKNCKSLLVSELSNFGTSITFQEISGQDDETDESEEDP